MDKQAIIKRCIIRSNYISYAKASRITIKHNKFFLNRIPIRFPSQNKLNDLDVEIMNVINEFERYIAQQLRPLFEEKGIRITDRFWFSNTNLKDGYILLDKNTYSEVPSHVLFLSPTVDDLDGSIIGSGDILPFIGIESTFINVKSVTESKESIAIKLMYKIFNQSK